jgi:anti-sigma-K factor RskA
MPQHVDPDDLALLAVGEHLDAENEQHVASCAECSHELAELRAVVGLARTVTAADTPHAPPSPVWDRVVAELAVDLDSAADHPPAADRAATVTDLPRGPDRRPSWPWMAAAAVAGIVLGAAATAVVLAGSDDDGSDGTGGSVVASADLVALPERSGAGAAEVVGSGASRKLEVDVSGLTRGDGFYEVWLLGPDAKTLVSVGLLDTSKGTKATFPLPADLDVAKFPVVDISLEPVDGDPSHSGDSIVRGTLAG